MSVKITTEMAKAGYEAVKQMASDHGYGWSFNMVSEDTVETAMGEVFRAMIEAAPAGWSPAAVATVRRGFVQPGAPVIEPEGQDPNEPPFGSGI